jgi:DUF1680 family protein
LLSATLLVGAATAAAAADRFAPLAPGDTRLGGEIGRRFELTLRNNLLKLEADKVFLEPFRQRKSQGGFVGLGMLIEAAVHFAAHTGDPKVVEFKRRLVAEAIQCQEPDGYLGAMVPASRLWKLWDLSEMAYLVQGLCADGRYFQEEASRRAAVKLADYVLRRWDREPQGDPTEGGVTMEMAAVGLERALLGLSHQTGDPRYRDFVVRHQKLPEWNRPITLGRWGRIEGHAYAYLARCLAQLQLYRDDPAEALLGPTRRAMDFLIRRDGLAITGTCGDHECWHDTQTGTINLGETCATAYLIRTLDNLFRLEGDPRYGDVLERAVYNALSAAQSPDGRQIRYYTPFDGPRAYFPRDDYCCPNNFRRIVSELPTMIYYRAADGPVINLYTASTAKMELPGGIGLALRQETDYPNSGKVVLHVDPSRPAAFSVRLRIPRWCKGAEAHVNGQRVEGAVAGGTLLTLTRSWEAGDRVALSLPMPWRLIQGRKAQAGCVAVARGPLLFCLNRQRHRELAGVDLRLLTIEPSSLEGPFPDASVRPDGLACRLRAWPPGAWYPAAPADQTLTLTEYADPAGEAIYFHVPNPGDSRLADDELASKGL